MEIPQQQRRPTIGQFAQQLKSAGLEFDAVDLADILWLAEFITSDPVAESDLEDLIESDTLEFPSDDVAEPNTIVESNLTDPSLNLYSNESSQSTSTTTTEPSPAAKGMPFPVPAAPAIRTRLDLARSLRPLMRKVPSRTRVDLDEEATVTQLAETRICVPVLQATPERWLNLDLVVESSKTTILWEKTITELQHLMEYQGAFRTVRTWQLKAEGHSVQLFPRWYQQPQNRLNQRPRSPRELIDPSQRRLILYVSDCTSPLWRQGIIHDTLWQWSETQPVALIQMLPERLWSRTALSNGHIIRLGATVPGLPNSRLNVAGLPELDQWDEWDETGEMSQHRSLILPIVTLDKDALGSWARVVAGIGDSQTPGRVFEIAFVQEMAQEYISPPTRTPQQRVELFRATASRTARQLAGLMAATPVSLPIIDLLRAEFLPNAQQVHVAEVLLSGLLQRCEAENSAVCQYKFFPGVRELLVDGVPIAKTTAILDRLSAMIAQKAGRTINSFEAFLSVLQESENTFGESILPFATIGLEVLQRLGGEYAELVERHELQRLTSELTSDRIDLLLQQQNREIRKIGNFPALKSFEYEPAIITNILERFEFETATIARENEEWVIHRRNSNTWGYTEPLNNEIGLEMVWIPGGTFLMGAPEDEPESYDDERPQHQVTLKPFCMGQYAVTQAQWRIVAGYPQIERELKPDPSRFKGDNRPVENVSWLDATEFCQRLSAHTGRQYKLPSEAQWEYACRAGTTTPFHFGETITTDLANYRGTDQEINKRTYSGSYGLGPKGEYREQTTDVGSFPANAWGLHDMHGNLWEWCEDDWHPNYEGAPDDGTAWTNDNRTNTTGGLRGGSWYSIPRGCRSAFRLDDDPRVIIVDNVGFRVVCNLPEEPISHSLKNDTTIQQPIIRTQNSTSELNRSSKIETKSEEHKMKLILVAPHPDLSAAFQEHFHDLPNVEIVNDRFETVPEYDCLVSSSNSFGLMYGGMDGAIIRYFGKSLMTQVQTQILNEYLGQQPVGTSLIVKTFHPQHPFLAHTPTMRVSMSVAGTDVPYVAMLAMLLAIRRHNREAPQKINSVVCPGFATGTGRVPYSEAARQMALAYDHFVYPPKSINNFFAAERQLQIWEGGEMNRNT